LASLAHLETRLLEMIDHPASELLAGVLLKQPA
jgi:hypothetical protein